MPDALWFTDDPAACKLLARDPFALLVGFAIDQQVTLDNTRISDMETLLAAKKTMLQNQFNYMEQTLAQLQSQSSALASLTNLSNSSSSTSSSSSSAKTSTTSSNTSSSTTAPTTGSYRPMTL